MPGAHTAETQAICLPVLSALFQAGVYIGWLSTAPSLTRSPQNFATFCVAASSMATFHLSPEVVHHLAPACWARPLWIFRAAAPGRARLSGPGP